MTTGAPLYLVSACGTAEEFVAAFRRYADRTGLFIPSSAPLPAGRRGRLAVTLKDGGVMIEGEAEILQSSSKPTVLHGRPGMTVKFVDPDAPSKIVIGELEKARLAMKPPPPSVPPRPAQIPAEPRPVVPAAGGRIDATNALAECVVIGDVSTLKETAGAPRPVGDHKSGPKFSVPAIPSAPARPKTPSTPPKPLGGPAIGMPSIKPPDTATKAASGVPTAAPKTPSGGIPTPTSSAPKTPSSGVPAPKTTPKTPSAGTPVPKMTSIGFPIVDKLPAQMGVASPVAPDSELLKTQVDSGLLQTKLGTEAPPNPTSPAMAAQNPLLETKLGHSPPRADATPPKFVNNATTLGMPALDKAPAASVTVHEESTTIGTGIAKPTDPMPVLADKKPVTDEEATAIGEAPVKKQTDPMPAAVPAAAKPEPSGSLRDRGSGQHRATSIGFPVVRNVFETQPLGLVPPAHGSQKAVDPEPAPPTLPSGRATPSAPRGKNPTAPPRHARIATPVAPVPIVRPPAKAAPIVHEEEKTDLSAVPPPPTLPTEPPPEVRPNRSGGMRASEILAAIPTGDWTMSPDESVPHALPDDAKVTAAAPQEPTPAPGAPPGPPTGNWTISLDPEGGVWGEPEKLPPGATPAPAPEPKPQPKSGNPVGAVASDKPITAVQWDEKPTGIGESKIEIDPTLMQPLTPMPDLDDPSGTGPAYEATAAASPNALAARVEGDQIPPPLAPMPPRPTTGLFADAGPLGPPPGFPMSQPMMGGYPTAPVLPTVDPSKRKRMIAMAVGAGVVAIGAIVLLVITLSGKDQPKAQPAPQPGSAAKAVQQGSAQIETPPPPEGSQVAVAPVVDAAVEKVAPVDAKVDKVDEKKPPLTGTCVVNVTSTPAGADILLGKQKLGTTPEKIELPCGVASKLSFRKKGSPNTARSYTPNEQTSKLAVKLGKTMFQVKVTSTPAGATITAGGKSMGVTPTTIKLPAFEPTSLTLRKPGFSADTQKVSPRQNNISHHVTLKRGR